MARLLSVIEDAFELAGRPSVVVVPGIPRTGDWRIKVGDPLRLRLPDGREVRTLVGGVEWLSPPRLDAVPLMLGPGLGKHDVPPGTEIWVD